MLMPSHTITIQLSASTDMPAHRPGCKRSPNYRCSLGTESFSQLTPALLAATARTRSLFLHHLSNVQNVLSLTDRAGITSHSLHPTAQCCTPVTLRQSIQRTRIPT